MEFANLFDMQVDYLDPGNLSVLPYIATTSLAAYKDTVGAPQDLTIASTSTVNMQFASTLKLTQVSGVNQSQDVMDVYFSGINNATYLQPSQKNMVVNDLKLSSESNQIYLTTDKEEGIVIRDFTTMEQSVVVNKSLVALGNIVGNTINVLCNSNVDSNVSEIGYGFTITSNHQLELIKYAKFADCNMTTNRIALFGSTKTEPSQCNDTSYLVFDELSGIAVANQNFDSLGERVFTASNVSLYGTTTLYGDLIPANTTVDLGSASNSFGTIYTSQLVFENSAASITTTSSNNLNITNNTLNNTIINGWNGLVITKAGQVGIGVGQTPTYDFQIGLDNAYAKGKRVLINTFNTSNTLIDLPPGAIFSNSNQFAVIHGNQVSLLSSSNSDPSLTRMFLNAATGSGTITVDNGSNITKPLILQQNGGFVGIGKTPSTQLDLSTDSARKLTTTTWSTGSDARVKQNIEQADLDMCYSNIKSINLRRFEWNPTFYPTVDDRHAIGFIAQEVEGVFPKSVTKLNDHGFEDFRNLDCDQIYKTMFGALQKCMEKLEQLERVPMGVLPMP